MRGWAEGMRRDADAELRGGGGRCATAQTPHLRHPAAAPSLLRTCAHALKPATAATVPALQALQTVEPGSDTVPGRHCGHVPLPAVAVGAG